jgi:hypothetical protein
VPELLSCTLNQLSPPQAVSAYPVHTLFPSPAPILSANARDPYPTSTATARLECEFIEPRVEESVMADTEQFDCIIAGGGPAGVVAGLLLARGGRASCRPREACGFLPRLPRRHQSTRRLCGCSTNSASTTGSPASPIADVTNISLHGPDQAQEFILGDLSQVECSAHPLYDHRSAVGLPQSARGSGRVRNLASNCGWAPK